MARDPGRPASVDDLTAWKSSLIQAGASWLIPHVGPKGLQAGFSGFAGHLNYHGNLPDPIRALCQSVRSAVMFFRTRAGER